MFVVVVRWHQQEKLRVLVNVSLIIVINSLSLASSLLILVAFSPLSLCRPA